MPELPLRRIVFRENEPELASRVTLGVLQHPALSYTATSYLQSDGGLDHEH